MWAAACNNKVVLRALLAEGANTTVKDNTGTTARGHAEAMGNTQCVEILSDANDALPKPARGSLFQTSLDGGGDSASGGGGGATHGKPLRDQTF